MSRHWRWLLVLALCWFGAASARAAEPQVAHMVFFSLADDSAAEQEKLVAACKELLSGHDGTVYFSDASSKFAEEENHLDMLEARPHGRLLAYDPASATTTVLLDDLYFANGVALSEAEDFVLINETYRYRIRRY